jgi:hypothetical protein
LWFTPFLRAAETGVPRLRSVSGNCRAIGRVLSKEL